MLSKFKKIIIYKFNLNKIKMNNIITNNIKLIFRVLRIKIKANKLYINNKQIFRKFKRI